MNNMPLCTEVIELVNNMFRPLKQAKHSAAYIFLKLANLFTAIETYLQ